MAPPFHRLSSITDLDTALTASHTKPIVIFKHSPTCGTSAMANEELQELVASNPAADVYIVYVREARAVSDALVARFGIRHESPQALIISKGNVVWHRSHFHVTAERIQAALSSLTDAA